MILVGTGVVCPYCCIWSAMFQTELGEPTPGGRVGTSIVCPYCCMWSAMFQTELGEPTPGGGGGVHLHSQGHTITTETKQQPTGTCTLARGFGSVVKHSTADPGFVSPIPPHSY